MIDTRSQQVLAINADRISADWSVFGSHCPAHWARYKADVVRAWVALDDR